MRFQRIVEPVLLGDKLRDRGCVDVCAHIPFVSHRLHSVLAVHATSHAGADAKPDAAADAGADALSDARSDARANARANADATHTKADASAARLDVGSDAVADAAANAEAVAGADAGAAHSGATALRFARRMLNLSVGQRVRMVWRQV